MEIKRDKLHEESEILLFDIHEECKKLNDNIVNLCNFIKKKYNKEIPKNKSKTPKK